MNLIYIKNQQKPPWKLAEHYSCSSVNNSANVSFLVSGQLPVCFSRKQHSWQYVFSSLSTSTALLNKSCISEKGGNADLNL